jgi:hypothetical protein
MKTIALILIFGLSIIATGCGPSKAERETAERERARIELERRAEEERRIANEAFRSIGDKIGRKAPGTTFAPSPERPAQPPVTETVQPAEPTKEP